MMRSCLFVGCLALALPAALPGAPGDPAGKSATVVQKDASHAPAGTSAAQPAPHRGSGPSVQWVYVDPKTGRFTDKPVADEQTMKALRGQMAAAAGAPEVLEAIPSVTPAGGLLVHIDNRFTSVLVATVGKDGMVTIRHEPLPRQPQGKE